MKGDLQMLLKIKVGILAATVLVLSMALFGQAAATPALSEDGVIPGHFIVQIAPNQNAAAVANEMAAVHALGVSHVYSHAFNGFAARIPEGRLNALRNDPRVVSIVEGG
jgi:subtilisin